MVSLEQQHYLVTYSHQNGHGLIKQPFWFRQQRNFVASKKKIMAKFSQEWWNCTHWVNVTGFFPSSNSVSQQKIHIKQSTLRARAALFTDSTFFNTFLKVLPFTISCFHRLLSTVLTEMFPVVSEGWILLFAECWSALCCIHWNFSCYYYYSVYYCHSFASHSQKLLEDVLKAELGECWCLCAFECQGKILLG